MKPDSKTKVLSRLALLAAALIWGGSFVVLKNALDGMPVFYIFSIRFLLGAAILAAVFFRRMKNINKKAILGSIPIGMCLFLAYATQTYGLIGTTPGINAFLTDVYCVLTPFLYWIFAKRRPDRFNIISSVICVVGIGLVSLDGSPTLNRGEILTLVCSVFFGLHLVFIDIFGRDCDPVVMTVLQFLVAGALSTPCAIILEQPPVITASALLQLGYLVVLATCGALLLQNVGQKYTPASQSAVLLSLESVTGVLFSVLFYGERPQAPTFIGFALIFIAITISETKLEFLRKKRSAETKAKE